MEKKTIVVLFGGQSSEHEVSLVSATNVIKNIDQEKYKVITVGITKEGNWLLHEGSLDEILDGTWRYSTVKAIISPNAVEKELIITRNGQYSRIHIDLVYPVLHGLYGEDGTIQGLLELARIPYVGCGVLASSVSMDKLYTKLIVDTLGIRQARYVRIEKNELSHINSAIGKVEQELSYPVFIKPSNAGSSIGVSKARNQEELEKGLMEAARHDRKILVEETIVGREIECAVLGGYEPKASVVGEILAAAEFYDYDAKYNNVESKTIIQPDLGEDIVSKIRNHAVNIFKAVDGYGESRVDFFLEEGSNEIVFNEINTMPGFTSISMYPMLWEATDVSKRDLVAQLIELGFQRYA